MSHLLEHDPTGLEDRRGGGLVQAEGRAIDVQDVTTGLGLPALEHDPAGFDAVHAAKPDDVCDLPQGLELAIELLGRLLTYHVKRTYWTNLLSIRYMPPRTILAFTPRRFSSRPTGAMFRAVGYAPADGDPVTIALIHGDPAAREMPLVHVHVACLFGDAFGSLLCDCRGEIDSAASAIAGDGAGVIIYAKPRQPIGASCVRGEPVDAALVAGLLRAAGVQEFRLLSDERDTRLREALRRCGLTVAV
jgi:GTP cyclohydrolase II